MVSLSPATYQSPLLLSQSRIDAGQIGALMPAQKKRESRRPKREHNELYSSGSKVT